MAYKFLYVEWKDAIGTDGAWEQFAGLEPLDLGPAEQGNLRPAVGPADDRTNGDGQNVFQTMSLGSIHAWVRQFGECAQQATRGLDIHVTAPSNNGSGCW